MQKRTVFAVPGLFGGALFVASEAVDIEDVDFVAVADVFADEVGLATFAGFPDVEPADSARS